MPSEFWCMLNTHTWFLELVRDDSPSALNAAVCVSEERALCRTHSTSYQNQELNSNNIIT